MALLTAGLVFAGIAAADQAKTIRIRGEIASHTPDAMTIHRRGGTVTLALGPNTLISAVRKMTLADIKPGSFISAVARTGTRGDLIAQEVVVFPDSARGTGEGQYAWDLGKQSSLTNATVDSVSQSTRGSDLHLSYKGGASTVTVPPGVPIVSFVAATAGDLTMGKKVFVVATVDAQHHFVAQRIVVEKDGVAPSM
jgi:hypothetical protein